MKRSLSYERGELLLSAALLLSRALSDGEGLAGLLLRAKRVLRTTRIWQLESVMPVIEHDEDATHQRGWIQ